MGRSAELNYSFYQAILEYNCHMNGIISIQRAIVNAGINCNHTDLVMGYDCIDTIFIYKISYYV